MGYFGDFSNVEDICRAFEIDQDTLSGVNVLLAAYDRGDYEGSAFVLYENEGHLFEVHAGHCSCYGLEGQWEPEETTWQFLQFRLEKGQHLEYAFGCPEALALLRDLVKVATSG